jgi:murein DD-endopeptidase MepM/ murein hydrolase activator NlpD
MSRCLIGCAAGAGFLGLAVVLAVPLAMVATMLGSDTGSATGSVGTAVSGATTCSVDSTGATVAGLDQDQLHNAGTLIAVGKSLHIPPRGWVVAISAALQESGLRNLDYGDRDSLGMLQQRPSAGWGTPDQVTNPTYAARAFYGGPNSPTRNTGLLGVPGWEQMPVWEAAQSVQRSAFPLAYAAHEVLASELVQKLADTTAGCQQLTSGPWGLPVAAHYVLTSGFGPRMSPTTGTADFHTGQDFAVPTGTQALAASSGVVEFTGWDGGYGNLVKLLHANEVETYYGHLSRIEVHPGEHVQRGSLLGLTGSTGNSTGPHLHFEVRLDGRPVDPMPFLRGKGLHP